jgi:hypothetical protein
LSGPSRVYRVRLLVTLLLITIIFTSLFYVLTRKWGQNRVLTLDKEEYGIDGRAVLTVRNIWRSTILVDVENSISRKVDDSCVYVPVLDPDEAYTAASRVLRPGESYRQVINLDGFQAGEYRLRKDIYHTDLEEMRAYYVGFTIIE